MQRVIKFPELSYEVGSTFYVGKEKRYIADIVYSVVENDWLVIYHVLQGEIIQSTHTVSVRELK